MLHILFGAFAGAAEPVMPMIDAAAAEFGVPRDLLAALAWQASRFDPDARSDWGGVGPMDLRPDRDPRQSQAAEWVGLSVDDLLARPEDQVRGAAAILLQQAEAAGGGAAPSPDDLTAWADALALFSGSPDPLWQRRHRTSIYELVYVGVDATSVRGEAVRFGGVPVDLRAVASVGLPVAMLPDYSGAAAFVAAASCNYTNDSRTGSAIDTLVVHTMQGTYSGAISWFQNCAAGASAHYNVRSSDGEITQSVAEADIAWHAGHWDTNVASIGIEHEGFIEDPDDWYTTEMYEASAALVDDIMARTSVLPDRNHVIAHAEVPGCPYSGGGAGCHTDPGDGWDWDFYLDLIEGTAPTTGTVIGVIAEDDIFTGARIPGATVVLTPGGDTLAADGTGLWSFDGLSEGTYTVTGSADGYDPASCTTTVTSSGQFWCSIALVRAGSAPPTDPPGGSTAPGGTTGPGGTAPTFPTSPAPGDDSPGDSPRTVSSLRSSGGCHHGASTDGLISGFLTTFVLLMAIRRRPFSPESDPR